MKKEKSNPLNERGQGLTEYIMLMLLISVVSIGVTRSMGGIIKNKIKLATSAINSGIKIADDAKGASGSAPSQGGGGAFGGLGGLGELAGGLFGSGSED